MQCFQAIFPLTAVRLRRRAREHCGQCRGLWGLGARRNWLFAPECCRRGIVSWGLPRCLTCGAADFTRWAAADAMPLIRDARSVHPTAAPAGCSSAASARISIQRECCRCAAGGRTVRASLHYQWETTCGHCHGGARMGNGASAAARHERAGPRLNNSRSPRNS